MKRSMRPVLAMIVAIAVLISMASSACVWDSWTRSSRTSNFWSNSRVTISRNTLIDNLPTRNLVSITVTNRAQVAILPTLRGRIVVEYIDVRAGSHMYVGMQSCPFTGDIEFSMKRGAELPGLGYKVFGVREGASLTMYGNLQGPSWSVLKQTANAGARTITVDGASRWRVGDEIYVASTDFNPRMGERRKITAVRGDTITLNSALSYMHYSGRETINGAKIDIKGEVAVMNRNIRVVSYEGASNVIGAQMKFAHSIGKVSIRGVEVRHGGQQMVMGVYPFHFHMAGNVAGKAEIIDSSVNYSFQRCYTIHGTSGVTLKNNVGADAQGHCVFLEDSVEMNNHIEHNLVINVRNMPGGKQLLPSDNQAAGFWITNPNNRFFMNVVAGAESIGFWYALPESPLGLSKSVNIKPYLQPLAEFRRNIAHGCDDGLFFDDKINPANNKLERSKPYYPRSNPNDPNSSKRGAEITQFTAYKNRGRGAWLRVDRAVQLKNSNFIENRIGFVLVDNGYAVNTIIVGHSANIGNPSSSFERSLGRSVPDNRGYRASRSIRGWQVYSGEGLVDRLTCANFHDYNMRRASCVGYREQIGGIEAPDQIKNFILADTRGKSNVAYLDGRIVGDAARTATVHDLDGSLTQHITGSKKAGQALRWMSNFNYRSGCRTYTRHGLQVCPQTTVGMIYVKDLDLADACRSGRCSNQQSWMISNVNKGLFKSGLSGDSWEGAAGILVKRTDNGKNDAIVMLNSANRWNKPVDKKMLNIEDQSEFVAAFNYPPPRKVELVATDTFVRRTHFITGLCYPKGSRINSIKANGRSMSRASSLNALKSSAVNTAYYVDGSGMIYVKYNNKVEFDVSRNGNSVGTCGISTLRSPAPTSANEALSPRLPAVEESDDAPVALIAGLSVGAFAVVVIVAIAAAVLVVAVVLVVALVASAGGVGAVASAAAGTVTAAGVAKKVHSSRTGDFAAVSMLDNVEDIDDDLDEVNEDI